MRNTHLVFIFEKDGSGDLISSIMWEICGSEKIDSSHPGMHCLSLSLLSSVLSIQSSFLPSFSNCLIAFIFKPWIWGSIPKSSWPISLYLYWPSPCLITICSLFFSVPNCGFALLISSVLFSVVSQPHLFSPVVWFSQVFIYPLSLFPCPFPWHCTCSVMTELQVGKEPFFVAESSRFPAFPHVGVSTTAPVE